MKVKRDIDEKKLSVMFDAEEFKKLLDKIVSQLTKELKKRMSQVH